MTTDIIELPNIIPPRFADEIEQAMTSIEFPWYFRENVSSQPGDPAVLTNDPNIKIRDAFIHLFYDTKWNIESQFAPLIKPLLYFIEKETGLRVVNVMRMRAVLTYRDPNWNEEHYLTPHVDDIDPSHTHTFVYYVNDCDGDTFFYDELYTEWNNYNKRTLIKRFTPKKGTGVLFNGHRYHGNGVGRLHNRIVINMNLTLE
jgi:hypothetical protein